MDTYTLSALRSAAGIMAIELSAVVVAGWVISIALYEWTKWRERVAERKAVKSL